MNRLLYTKPFDKVLEDQKQADTSAYSAGHAHVHILKAAGAPTTTHALSGELYASKSGWILLDIPNALVRGAFDALNEAGAELPLQASGNLNAHISVMRPEEIEQLGGIDKITERGHHFHYTLGPVMSCKPDGWGEMSKVWFIQCKSKELQDLRKSYGLSSKPNENKYDFHVTIGTRRKKVLQDNDVAKNAGIVVPLLRTGGLITDVAGLQALTGKKDDEPDPASDVMADNSYLNDIKKLPTSVPSLRKRRKTVRPPVLDKLANNGEYDGLWRMQTSIAGGTESETDSTTTRERTSDTATTGKEGSTADCETRSECETGRDACTYEKCASKYNEETAFDAIFAYYDTDKSASAFSGIIDKPRAAVENVYAKLKQRYGPTMAKIIVGTGAAGLPIPIPGSTLATAAPALAAGEAMHVFNGDYNESIAKKHKRRKALLERLKTMALPAGAAGAAGLALHNPTNTLVPAQVTKFPGQDRPRVIRGPIYHGAPASVLEDTGGGYAIGGPSELELTGGGTAPVNRTHIVAEGWPDFVNKLKQQQRPGHPLEIIEALGHGTPLGQGIGHSHDARLSNPDAIHGRSADQFADAMNTVPRSNNSTFYEMGCNSGLCTPPAGTTPNWDFNQRIADRANMNVMAPRGYTTLNPDATWVDTHSTGRGQHLRNNPIDIMNQVPGGQQWSIPSEDYTFTRYSPNQPRERVVTQKPTGTSKETFSKLPAGRLHELLYNVGKPSAIAGSVLSPLMSNKQTAKRVAMVSSALAAPMAISEILIRAGQARGELATRGGNPITTHLSTQAKALPYAALAALPMLSYGGAKLLGRWKDKPKNTGLKANK